MAVRPLELLDLPLIYRHRDEVAGLDSTRLLTRGNPLGAVGLMAYINPARHVHAALADGNGRAVLGGIIQTRGEQFAKLLFLAPVRNLDNPELPALLDALAEEAGSWGAFHVSAEVEETGDAFLPLRRAGYAVYAWQRMWDVSEIAVEQRRSGWKRVRSADAGAVQSLYQQIVPPLLHAIEPVPQQNEVGWISNEGSRCYAGMRHGLYGIVLSPLIHPEASEVSVRLASLIGNLPDRRGRPVYVCVRSYEAWLEPVLADLGAKAASRQAVMVKHLAHPLKDEQAVKLAQPARASVQPSRVTHIQKNGS